MTEAPDIAPHARAPRLLVLVLLVGLLLRLTWALVPTINQSTRAPQDSEQYLSLARNVLRGAGLSFTHPDLGREVHAFHAPGYSLLLAACGAREGVARVVQSIVDTSTLLAVYLLARRWLCALASTAAVAIAAVNPWSIRFAGSIGPETLYAALLAWSMVLLTRENVDTPPASRARPTPWFCGVALLALSTLVRPSGAGLTVILALASLFLNRSARNPVARRRHWPPPAGATALLMLALVMTPWAFRNARVIGRWVWTTTGVGFQIYEGLHEDDTGKPDERAGASMPYLANYDEPDRSNYLIGRSAEIVRQNPRFAAALAGRKALRYLSPAPLAATDRFSVAAGWLYILPLEILILLGLTVGRLPRAARVFLLIPAVYFMAVHALSSGPLRYRTPTEPPMAILGASLVAASRPGWKRATS